MPAASRIPGAAIHCFSLGRKVHAVPVPTKNRDIRSMENGSKVRGLVSFTRAMNVVRRFCETPFYGLASDTDALQFACAP